MSSTASSATSSSATMTGTVKWFDVKKGFGFILNEDGQDVFVHFSSIEGDGFRALKDGEPVEYESVEGPKGLLARKVRRLATRSREAARSTMASPNGHPDRSPGRSSDGISTALSGPLSKSVAHSMSDVVTDGVTDGRMSLRSAGETTSGLRAGRSLDDIGNRKQSYVDGPGHRGEVDGNRR